MEQKLMICKVSALNASLITIL